MQEVWVGYGEAAELITLPHPDIEVMPEVRWGCASAPFTPAYWVARCRWPSPERPQFVTSDGLLAEELGFCLLGGFGIRYEVNKAAFERLRRNGVFDLRRPCSQSFLENLLRAPLSVSGRSVRYRFPYQRAKRIDFMRRRLSERDISSLSALDLRKALLEFDGVGPKTASWVVRNLLGSDEVAILDVHIVRVCQAMGLFPKRIALPHDYERLELRFLKFAEKTGIAPSTLDAVMWSEARSRAIAVDSAGP